ncbi:SPFH domain / Band 7 family protein [Collimonas sp. OK307]|uniref:SPFH domain-containing protein n=1 Tax=Collimonas sp. OK307 TaxID=1801620 RepID=UPI0008DEF95A|nr:SPFH domain-containing protein [Collimonas sp. OK307]SFI33654.1 SPFH domain / Band 7 family protein [Collimonas sp. OK307]
MFSVKFIKVQPTTYVLQYKNGLVKREGAGLAFFYYAPTTSMVAVPMGSEDVPFIFDENSADFQQITVQGQVTYRISDPKKIGALLDFSINPVTQKYISEDPTKLSQRIINAVKVLTRKGLQRLPLRDALRATDTMTTQVASAIKDNSELQALGVEILGLSFLAIKPTPETARALEAEAREQILKVADEAVYARRNSAVEQERRIKENELNTEIAVEAKKRQIRETQMDAEQSIQQKQHELQQSEMEAKIALEAKNTELVSLAMENAKREADVKSYSVKGLMQAYQGVDPKLLQALAMAGMQPGQMIAMAFQELADKAGKIGQLNITPDLLREVIDSPVR